MAIINDPDDLNQGVEVTINPTAKTIALNLAGNLSDDGVTGQALYSFLKEEWRSDNTLIAYDFPQVSIRLSSLNLLTIGHPPMSRHAH